MANEKFEITKEFLQSKGFERNHDPLEQQFFLFKKEIYYKDENDYLELVIHRMDGEMDLAIVQDGVFINLIINSRKDFDRAEQFAKMIKNIDLP
jgi:hypothetical protein